MDATSWRAPRSGGRRTPGRSLRDLPWCARKRRGAARPLCSCLREGLKIQLLYLPLKAQRQTDRAKIFAISFCLKFVQTRVRSSQKKRLLFCLRASFVLPFGLQTATQKLNLLIFAPQSGKTCFFVARCGFPKGIRPFGPAMFACSRQLTSKLAISACRNLFSLVRSLSDDKE